MSDIPVEIVGLHPIFKDCCAPDDVESRYAISHPWIKDGWICATDARICVRQATTLADRPPPNGKTPPDLAGLSWDMAEHSHVPVDLPAIPDEELRIRRRTGRVEGGAEVNWKRFAVNFFLSFAMIFIGLKFVSPIGDWAYAWYIGAYCVGNLIGYLECLFCRRPL